MLNNKKEEILLNMTKFVNAYKNLLDSVLEYDDDDVDFVNDVIANEYPLGKDMYELLFDIYNWQDDVEDKFL